MLLVSLSTGIREPGTLGGGGGEELGKGEVK